MSKSRKPQNEPTDSEPFRFCYTGSNGDKVTVEYREGGGFIDYEKKRCCFKAEVTVEYEYEGFEKLFREIVEFDRLKVSQRREPDFEQEDFENYERNLDGKYRMAENERLRAATEIASKLVRERIYDVVCAAYTFLTSVAMQLAIPIVNRRLSEELSLSEQFLRDVRKHLPTASELSKKLEGIFNRMIVDSMREFLRGQGGREKRYSLDGFSEHYNQVLPFWKDAKKLYIERKNRDWREEVKELFRKQFREPYPFVHEDLIEWLVYPGTSELLETILGDLDDTHFLNNHREIAYEHAARLCGASKYCYAPGTLKNKT